MRALCSIAVFLAACGSFGDTPFEPDASVGTCDDGVRNNDETDVDCGGSCGVCSVGKSCDDGNDCATSACAAGVCLTASSCRVISSGGITESGIYTLNIDGEDIDAFCDMETDGGGWTLILKASSETTTLAFDSPLWTDNELLAADDVSPNSEPVGIDAKFPTYLHVVGTELRLQFLDPVHDLSYGPFPSQSALALFSAPESAVIELDSGCNPQALTDVPGYDASIMRHGQGHQFFGINGEDRDGGEDDSLRFGFGSNDEGGSPWRPRNGIGGEDESLVWLAHTDCDSCGGCYGTAYVPAVTSANLWLR